MIRSWFARRRDPRPEVAPQYPLFLLRALAQPGPPPGALPYETIARMERDPMI